MESLLADIRFAFRSLTRRRLFAAVAVTTIALAIGSATSIFSVVDAVLFRSLPYRDPGRLVAIWQAYPGWKKEPILARQWDHIPLDYGDFIGWRARQTSFSSIGLWTNGQLVLTGANPPEIILDARVSPSLFQTLDVRPALGRLFLPGEDVIGGPHVTVISYDTWQTRFGGRRDIVGRTVAFDGQPYVIVGVLPEGFTLERGQPASPFWVIAGQDSSDVTKHNHSFNAIGRLSPGITLDRAEAETRQLLQGTDAPEEKGVKLSDFQRDETRKVRAPLLVLLYAVGLLLLIACVNIATLLLGEASVREQEIGARTALGASRARIVRQLLTESALLAVVGGALGALLAWWGTRGLVALAPERIPGLRTVHVDLRVLGVSMVASLATGLLFGLAPALSSTRVSPALVLRSGGQSAGGRGRLQRILIAAELALSVLLLVGAALLSRSFAKLTAVQPGFRSDHLLAISASLPRPMSRDSIAVRAFNASVTSRLSHLPGVSRVAGTSEAPFSGGSSSTGYVLEGDPTAHQRQVQHRTVTSGFFTMMGIPILVGREFSDTDRSGAEPVAVISESAARRDWPNESPIGKRAKLQGKWWTIIGIAGDVKFRNLSSDVEATMYMPQAQRQSTLTFLVRTVGDPASLSGSIREAIHDAAPSAAVLKVSVMDDSIRHSFGEERFRTLLIGLFGAMAMILAAVGMFGVTSRAVSRRTREMGIRVALGATTGSVIRLLVGQTLTGVAIGVAIGLAGALAAGPALSPFLFGVSAADPIAYGAIFLLLASVSLLASWIPARRAGRVQPAAVLRGE